MESVAQSMTAVVEASSDVFFFDAEFCNLITIIGDSEIAVHWIRQACNLIVNDLRELLDTPSRSIPSLRESVPIVDKFFLKISKRFSCKKPELTALITQIQQIAQTSEHPDHAEILPVILNWQSLFAS
jgi:hypothetical protein